MISPVTLARTTGLTQVAPEVDLSGRTAVITGAADGIGRAMAKAYHRFGAHVIGVDVQENRLAELKKELGDRFTPVPFDLRRKGLQSFKLLTRRIVAAAPNGIIDIYAMNAAVIGTSGEKSFFRTTMQEHDAIDAINHRSHKALLLSLRPYLEQSDAGRVILTSSPIVGRVAPGTENYGRTKGALEYTLANARAELREDGSRILVAGWVPPPVQNLLRATHKNEPVYANPLPEDVVEIPLRLASPALSPQFDGTMLVLVDKRTKNVTGHDKDGAPYTYDWNKRNDAGDAFDLGIRIRDLNGGGGTEGAPFMDSYDTMTARRLVGAGPVPPFDEKFRLRDWKEGYATPQYLERSLNFGNK